MPTRSRRAWAALFLMPFAIGALATTLSLADEKEMRPAPFGLFWGMSKADIQSFGIKLTDPQSTKLGEALSANDLPKMVADVEDVWLFFGYDDQLWRIVATSEPFHNDRYGIYVRERYDQLVQDKYGPGAAEQHVAEHYDGEDWSFGIATGHNWHQTTFNQVGLTAQIRVSATTMSETRYILDFQEDDLARKVEQGRRQSEHNAL